MSDRVDLLAIAAHRDDIELTCGGTLLRAAAFGHRTAILDLTAGEAGTRGSAALRAEEASRAAAILGVAARENLGMPDAGIVNTPAARAQIAAVIRRFAPTVVIAPALHGRHPDHRVTAELVRDACFVAGLAKIVPELPPHRPRKVIHCVTYREDWEKPTFVVDIRRCSSASWRRSGATGRSSPGSCRPVRSIPTAIRSPISYATTPPITGR